MTVKPGNIRLDIEQGSVVKNIHGRSSNNIVVYTDDLDNIESYFVDTVGRTTGEKAVALLKLF